MKGETQSVTLKTKKATKYQLSISQKKELCEKWQLSPLDKIRFCHEHGISKSAFYNWCKHFDIPYSKKQSLFTSIKIDSQRNSMISESVIGLEILLANQSILRVNISRLAVISFIKELCDATTTLR